MIADFEERWYLLLQKVSQPVAELEGDAKPQTHEVEVEEVKSAEQVTLNKLAELRKIKKEVTAKSKLSMKNMYHESFFFKMLALLDFYTSMALVSPAALAFVQQVSDPSNIQVLVQLLVLGVSRNKITVLRILQNLMKLDFPTEIFDRAIDLCVKDASENIFCREIATYLSKNSSLTLGNVPFFKLIYSMILDVQETIWQSNEYTKTEGMHAFAIELTRTFKSLSQNGQKNLFVQRLVSSKIRECLLTIQDCPEYELDAIMGIIGESAPN